MNYNNIREEELKNKIAQDYFQDFDCSKIIGNVDFCVIPKAIGNNDPLFETQSLLWAEAKKCKSDIVNSIVQLILTIGKARTFDKQLPPAFLGAFDGFQIAFLPYNDIHEIFYVNDFNWNVTPSNYDSKEFKLLRTKVQDLIQSNSLQFKYATDHSEIQDFIKVNLVANNSEISKIHIDKNNFFVIYNKWLASVKPTINFPWDKAKTIGIIDADFYLADLLSSENQTFKDNLYVQLDIDKYQLDRKLDDLSMFSSKTAIFIDDQKAHHQFWNRYQRPPKEEYRDYIVERRDLLVPQDVRERKGSFFTPQIWVELSQKYLTDVLDEKWQDEYYIWDCAAGTGNLLADLTNKYNIWASTLDTQDVDVMRDRIKNGANLLESHCFQFDFLNDEFSKLPQGLQDIVNDPEKRKKLVVYINPPYAESGSGVGRGFKDKVATDNKTYEKYKDKLGKASNELFAQFLIRIQQEIQGCIIGEFSKLKLLNGGNSETFRNYFLAKLESFFIVPGDTFDNVKGSFPIGFKIWNTAIKAKFVVATADVFDSSNIFGETKTFYSYDDEKGRINDWFRNFFDKQSQAIGILHNNKNDFQHNQQVRITTEDINDHTTPITSKN